MSPLRSESLEALSLRFGRGHDVMFELSPLGGIVARLRAEGSEAVVALHGAQVLDWQPAGHGPVLWLSPLARLDAGKPVRGGIPVCWPWFGPAPRALPARSPDQASPAWPQHGFARNSDWRVLETWTDAQSASISLAFGAPADGGAGWPHRAVAILTVRLAQTLSLTLETQNSADSALDLTQALHSYLRVGDIADIMVEQLDGHAFHDATEQGLATEISTKLRSQTGPVRFDREVDRIYLQSRGPVSVIDSRLGRRIEITKSGSASTVVWNPGADRVRMLGDVDDDGWRQFVCIEPANTVYDPVALERDGKATLSAVFAVARL